MTQKHLNKLLKVVQFLIRNDNSVMVYNQKPSDTHVWRGQKASPDTRVELFNLIEKYKNLRLVRSCKKQGLNIEEVKNGYFINIAVSQTSRVEVNIETDTTRTRVNLKYSYINYFC